MKICWSLLLVFGMVCAAQAQDKSLDGLSGKAKAKALKQEEKAAKKDVEFQALMSEAHDLFSSHQFDEALALYERAHERRPLNQFPKVKMEDVKLALANYVEPEEEEEKQPEQTALPPPISQPEDQEERVQKAYEKELERANADVDPQVNLPPPPVEDKQEAPKTMTVKSERPEVMTVEELRTSLGEEYEDGVHEKTFEEGKKVITERIVVKDGKGDFYRKVVQPWGQTYYFKNYKSASQYTWDQSYK